MAILRLERANPAYAPDHTMTLTLHSSHLSRRQSVVVYNGGSPRKDLPVVLLLHGVYGSENAWMYQGGVHLVYERLRKAGLCEFVLVMPSDGGIWDGSAYLPLGEHGDYDQWIMDDVVAAISQSVDAVTPDSHWYITGLSMGGYGALRLGAKYASFFSGISAHSAITKIEDIAQFVEVPFDAYACDFDREHDILYWLDKNHAALPPLRFDCGRSDLLFDSNKRFAADLESAGFDFSFEAFPGAHEWPYWHEHIAKTLLFFHAIACPPK